jgi:hypothetical protein
MKSHERRMGAVYGEFAALRIDRNSGDLARSGFQQGKAMSARRDAL